MTAADFPSFTSFPLPSLHTHSYYFILHFHQLEVYFVPCRPFFSTYLWYRIYDHLFPFLFCSSFSFYKAGYWYWVILFFLTCYLSFFLFLSLPLFYYVSSFITVLCNNIGTVVLYHCTSISWK